MSSCSSTSSLSSADHVGNDPHVSPSPRQFSLFYTNCRSLLPKLDNLRVQATSLNPCTIALTETWLDANISSHELCIPGYSTICRDRNLHGGSILLCIRSDIPILATFLHPTLELLLVDIHLRQGKMLIVLFYPLLLCLSLMNWKPLS